MSCSLADKAATAGEVRPAKVSGTRTDAARWCIHSKMTIHAWHIRHFGGRAMPEAGVKPAPPKLKEAKKAATLPVRTSSRLDAQLEERGFDPIEVRLNAKLDAAGARIAANDRIDAQIPLVGSVTVQPMLPAHQLANAIALLVSSTGKCSRSAGRMASAYTFGDGWMAKVDKRFHFRLEHEFSNFDLVTGLPNGLDLVHDMVQQKGFASVEAFYEAFEQSLMLRFASVVCAVVVHLNVWPSPSSNRMVARSLRLPTPVESGHCWSQGLLMVALALKRSGWSTVNGLLSKSGYDGMGLRRGLICTVIRLVLVPRDGQAPLFFVVATNANIGMNWGSCHSPAPAVPQAPGGQPPTEAWLGILARARELLLRLHADRTRPHGPVCQADDERLISLRSCRMHQCPDYDRKPDNDEDIVEQCEATCGCELFSLEELDAPFPPALFIKPR